MKNKNVVAITLISVIAASVAFYFWKMKAGRVEVSTEPEETNDGGEVKKRVHEAKSPIRKYLRKAKTASA